MKKAPAKKKTADLTKAAAPHTETPAAPIVEKATVAPIVTGPISENVLFDGVSMTFKQGTTLEQWTATLDGLVQSSKVSQWCLGDALNFGSHNFKKDYKAACEHTGLANGTLRTAASVAKRFAPAKRRLSLSFEHHRLLAPVKDEAVVAQIMDRVEKEGLSVAAMKELIPAGEQKPKTPEQIDAADIAESTRNRENAEKLVEYLKKILATKAKHTRLAVWPSTLKMLRGLDYDAMITIGEFEGRAAKDRDPITAAK